MLIPILTACEAANQSIDGHLNILGAYCRFWTENLPVSHNMAVAVRVWFEQRDGEGMKNIEIKVIDGAEKSIGECAAKMDVQFAGGYSGTFDFVAPCVGTFKTFGEHAIILIVDGKWQARTPIIVERTPPPTSSPKSRG